MDLSGRTRGVQRACRSLRYVTAAESTSLDIRGFRVERGRDFLFRETMRADYARLVCLYNMCAATKEMEMAITALQHLVSRARVREQRR